MKSSFNAFGKTKKVFDAGSTPVWLGTVTPVPKGGVLAQENIVAGAIYAAGTPVIYEDGYIYPLPSLEVKSHSGNKHVVHVNGALTDYYSFEDSAKVGKIGTFDEATSDFATVTAAVSLGNNDYELTLNGAAYNPGETLVFIGDENKPKLDGTPNGYLYNDICIGDIDTSEENVEAGIASATGAVVMYHAEGILIDRTPAAGMAEAMAKAVPHVLQVKG